MRFKTIYADPPWHYRDTCTAGKRGAAWKYPVLSDDELLALPVATLAAERSALFLWSTWPKIAVALACMERWGYQYKTCAFVWVKVATRQRGAIAKMKGSRRSMPASMRRRRVQDIAPIFDGLAMPQLHWGMGTWTRSNTEFCLLGTRGNLKSRSHAIHQVIHAPVAEHSAKPPQVRRLITALAGGPRVELFARGALPLGWHGWGNQATGPRVLASDALAVAP